MLEATTLLENKSDEMNCFHSREVNFSSAIALYKDRRAPVSSLQSSFHVVDLLSTSTCWLHICLIPIAGSATVLERNLNNVPTIKSLLLGRSKCTHF